MDSKGYPQLARPGMIYPSVAGSDGHAIHLTARAQKLADLARIWAVRWGIPSSTRRPERVLRFHSGIRHGNTGRDEQLRALKSRMRWSNNWIENGTYEGVGGTAGGGQRG